MKKIISLLSSCIIYLLFVQTDLQAQPTYNNCATPQTVTSLTGACVGYTNVGATPDGLVCATAEGNNTVFFQFTAIGPNLTVTVDGPGGFRPEISILSGSACAGGACVASQDGFGNYDAITYTGTGVLTIGTTYYIAVTTNNDATATFDLCVTNPSTAGCAATNNDCLFPTAIAGVTTGGAPVCITGCNNTGFTGPDFTGVNCEDFLTNTVWYSVPAGATAATMNVTLASAAFSNAQVAVFTSTLCFTYTLYGCSQSASGTATLSDIPINPSTTYLIAVSDWSGDVGSFNLCVDIDADLSACAVNTSMTVTSTSMGSPASGPFQAGELVTFCWTLTNWNTGASCQFLQGIVPTFGDCWDPISFGVNGVPVTITTPLSTQGVTGPDMTVGAGVGACANGPAGAWNWYPAGAVVYNVGLGTPLDGTPLPAGWFFTTFYDTPQPDTYSGCVAEIDPDNSWGDNNWNPFSLSDCANTLDWTVCFTLRARDFTSCSSGQNNCLVSIQTYADGEIGAYVQVGCQNDIPTNFNGNLCCISPPIPINNSRCDAGTVILGSSGCTGNVNWYAASTGGAILFTGTSFTTPSISATTTYWISCASGGCTSVRVPVVAEVAQPVLTNIACLSTPTSNVCPSSVVNLCLTSNNIPEGTTSIEWMYSTTAAFDPYAAGTSAGTITTTPASSTTAIGNWIPPTALGMGSGTTCASLLGVMVNVCGAVEEDNEYVVLLNGSNFLNTNDIALNYPNTGSGGVGEVIDITTANLTDFGTNVGVTPVGACVVTATNGTLIPPNVPIVIFPSNNVQNVPTPDLSSLCTEYGIVYVLYVNVNPTIASFGNGTAGETFTLTTAGCAAASYTYAVPSSYYDAQGYFATFNGTTAIQNNQNISTCSSCNPDWSQIGCMTFTLPAAPASCGNTYYFKPKLNPAPFAPCAQATFGTPLQYTVVCPTAVDPADIAVCAGATVPATLLTGTPTPGVSFIWSASSTTIGNATSGTNTSTVGGFTAINATAAPITTTFTITPYSFGGNGISNAATLDDCLGPIQTFTITVNPLPTSPILPPVSTTCTASTVIIGPPSATATYTYSWSSATGLSADNIYNPVANPASTTTYTLTVTAPGGCTASATQVVTVNETPPTAPVLAGVTTTCTTPTATIGTATAGGFTYVWTPAATLSSATIFNPIANPAATQTYSVTITDANGCTASATQVVTVNETPPVANAGADLTLNCTTTSGTIGVASVAGNTYAWTPTINLSTATTSNPTANPTATTTYTLLVTNTATGCTATDNVVVTVNTTPPIANAGADLNLTCGNTSGTIGVASVAGNTYAWTPTTNLSTSTTSNPTANPTATTTYTLVVTNTATGCTATDNVVVTVNTTPPVANAGADLNLTCGITSGTIGVASVAGNTYAWTPTTNLSTATTSNPTANPTATTTYTLVVTNIATGCTATDNVVVTVNTTPPIADAGTDVIFDCNSPITGVSIGMTPVAGVNYAWNPTTNLSNSSIANPNATPTSTTSYTLTATNPLNGCSTQDVVVVTVAITTSYSQVQTDVTCNGASDGTASVTVTSGGTYTYIWNDASASTSSSIVGLNAGAYNVTITPAGGGGTVVGATIFSDNFNTSANWDMTTDNTGSNLFIINNVYSGLIASPTPDQGGGSYLHIYSAVLAGIDDQAVFNAATASAPCVTSNAINTIGYTNVSLNFDWLCDGSASDFGAISYSTDGILFTPLLTPLNLQTSWTTETITNPAFDNQSTLYFQYCWQNDNTGGNDPALAVDNILITGDLVGGGGSGACPVVATFNIIEPLATAAPSAVAGANCGAGTVSFSVSSSCGGTLTWYDAAVGGAILGTGPTYTTPILSLSTTYYVGCSVGSCVSALTPVVATINNVPIANAGVDIFLSCTSPSALLNGAGSTAGLNYQWNGPSGYNQAGISPAVAATTVGVYTLTVTNPATSCTSNDLVEIFPSAGLPIADAGADQVISCLITNVTLDGSASSVGVNYEWTGPTGIIGTAATQSVSLIGTYSLTITDVASGCTQTDIVEVTSDNATPTADAGANQLLTCTATSVIIDGSLSSAGVTYEWDGPSGFNDFTISPTVSTAGLYTLTVTNLTNGCTAQDIVDVTASAGLPTANAGVDQLITCTTISATLNGVLSSAGVDYQWSGPSGLLGTAITQNVTASGTYTLTVTDIATGCIATDDVVITADNVTPTANAGPDQTLSCSVASVTLNGALSSAGVAYQWSNSTGLLGTAATQNASTTDTYTLTVTNLTNGCSDQDIVDVIADASIPTANAGASQTLTCTSTSVTLDGTGSSAAMSYQWSNASGLLGTASTQNTTTTGIYTLTVTNPTNGCSAAATVLVNANNTAPFADAGAAQVLSCSNAVVTLDGSLSTSAMSYVWTGPAGYAGAFTQITSTTISGTYTLTVSNPLNGCSTSDNVIVTIDTALPPANAGADVILNCTTTSATIGVVGSPLYDYSWSPSLGLSSSTSSNPTASPSVATTYTLTVTNITNGCTAVDLVFVDVAAGLPIADAGADVLINCTTTSVTLDGSSSSVGFNYAWSGPGSYSSLLQNPTGITVAGVYTLTVTDPVSLCSATDAVLVTNSTTVPNANAGADATYSCTAGSVTITASSTTTGVNYAWSGPGGFSTIGNTAIVSAAGLYTVLVTELSTGCTATDAVNVTADINTPLANAGADQLVTCVITNVSLNGSASSAGMDYQWSGPTGLLGTLVTQNAAVTGIYTLTVTNTSNGCTAQDFVEVIGNTASPIANAGADQFVNCTLTSVTLNATLSDPGVTYAWSGPGSFSATSSTPSANITGNYTLVVTSTINGCTAQDVVSIIDNSVLVNANAGPDLEITCINTTVTATASSTTPLATYSWSGPAGFASAANSITVSTIGNYTVKVTDPTTGCTASDIMNVAANNSVPSVNAGSDVAINCNNISGTLTGTTTATNPFYTWTGPTGTQFTNAITTATGGAYTLTVSDLITGCSATDIANVTVDVAIPNVILPDFVDVCITAPTFALAGALPNTGGTGVYTIDGIAAVAFNPTLAGVGIHTISYTFTNSSNGCTASASDAINVEALPILNVGSFNDTVCQYSPSILLTGSPLGGTFSGTDILGNTFTPNTVGLQTINYSYGTTVGCTANYPFTILVNPTPVPSFLVANGCVGEAIDVVYTSDISSVDDITWSFPGASYTSGTDGDGPFVIEYNDFGYHTITVIASNDAGCIGDTTGSLFVSGYSINTINDATIQWGEQITLNTVIVPSFHNEATNVFWTPNYSLTNDTIEQPIANPQLTTTYVVTIIDTMGCVSTDTVTITVQTDYEFYVPNAFSPNNDGTNETFRPYGKNVKSIELRIYNRWGEKVYETNDINEGWDGKFKDKLCDPAVFVYTVEAEFVDGYRQVYKGNLTLVR